MLSLWSNPLIPVKEKSDSRMSTKNYFDRLFEDAFSTMTQDLFPWSSMGIENQKNEDGSLSVNIDLPGIKAEDIAIELKNNVVSIKGKRQTTTSTYEVNRSFSVSEGYSSEDIKAELSNGVLTLTLIPKLETLQEIKKIPVISK